MSAPVTTQLRDYFAFVDAQQGAVDLDSLGERKHLVTPVRLPVVTRRRRKWVAALVAAMVVLVVGMTILFSASGQRNVSTTVPFDSTTSLLATTTLPASTTSMPAGTTTTITSTTPPDSSPQTVSPEITQIVDGTGGFALLVADRDSVLVVSSRSGISGKLEVNRIDASTGEVIDTIPDYGYSGWAVEVLRNDDQLWISFQEDDGGEPSLLRFDLRAREVTARIPTPSLVNALAMAGDSVWAFQYGRGELLRIHPDSAEIIDRVTTAPGRTVWASAVDGSIWAIDENNGLYAFAPASGEFLFSDAPNQLVPGEDEWRGVVDAEIIWLISLKGNVERFDTTTGVATDVGPELRDGQPTGNQPDPFWASGVIWEGGLWIPSSEGLLYRIDLASGEAGVHPLEGAILGRPVIAGESLWIPRLDNNTVIRIEAADP